MKASGFLPLAALAIGLACARPAGRGGATDAGAGATGRLRVVTTTGLIADVARAVGGPHVEVTALMGPGVDPHLYKASAGDVSRLADAMLILYHGLHLEGAMAEVFERLEGRKPARAVADAIPPARLLEVAGFPGQHDPHVWFDVVLWRLVTEAVRDALMDAAPAHADAFRDNAAAYQAQLDELDAHVRARVATLPAERRVLVTAHDAFAYFGRAYGFEVRGLQGVSTATEAGTADVRALAGFLVERGVPAIFVESSLPLRTIQAVQAAVAARGARVTIGGSLYSDALGSPGSPAGTYLGMVRANVDTIVSALGGPPRAQGGGAE